VRSNVIFILLVTLTFAFFIYALSTIGRSVNISYAPDFALMDGQDWTELDAIENQKAYRLNKIIGLLSFTIACGCAIAAVYNRKARRIEKFIKEVSYD